MLCQGARAGARKGARLDRVSRDFHRRLSISAGARGEDRGRDREGRDRERSRQHSPRHLLLFFASGDRTSFGGLRGERARILFARLIALLARRRAELRKKRRISLVRWRYRLSTTSCPRAIMR